MTDIPYNISCLEQLRGGLIVSCQASAGEPLDAPEHILALALSTLNGGACALRLEGLRNIEHVRKHTKVPLIGLIKAASVPESQRLDRVYITATLEEARRLAQAGSDIIALDATGRPRGDGLTLVETIERIHNELAKPVWADVATGSEGHCAYESGADVISTTLSGYTRETCASADAGPDFALLRELCAKVRVPVVLEGRVWKPDEVRQAFELGAFAVVVGSAITRPELVTRRFVQAIPR